MIYLNRNKLIYLISLLAVLVICGLVFSIYTLQQHQQINQQITLLNQGEMIDAEKLNMQSAEVRIAYAHLQRKLNLFDEAVETYSGTERLADKPQLVHIHYNLGNLYLIQAIDLAENLSVDRAVAMADVAKDFYRSALKNQPSFWEAKYNLEAAQRLSRDLPLGDVTISEESQDASTELWSAMPGFPIGLP
jgi:mxaK protein